MNDKLFRYEKRQEPEWGASIHNVIAIIEHEQGVDFVGGKASASSWREYDRCEIIHEITEVKNFEVL